MAICVVRREGENLERLAAALRDLNARLRVSSGGNDQRHWEAHHQGGVFTTIDVPGAQSTFASAISPNGEIVGTYRNSGGHSQGFVLTP